MSSIGQALNRLGIVEYILRGEPTNQEEFNQMFSKITGQNPDGESITSEDPSEWGVTWAEIETKVAEVEAEEPLRRLREERNALLSQTDWWVLPDRTPTQAQLDYRQALRDITDTYTSLDDVVWPTKP